MFFNFTPNFYRLKIARLVFLMTLLWANLSEAQDYNIIDNNLQIRSVQFDRDVYIPEMGTKGIMLVIEYYYSTSSKYLVTFGQEITAFKYGIEVYSDTSTYLVMRPNEWNKARKFIPYRNINVPEGQHDDIELHYKVPGVVDFKAVMKFEQPARYAVTLDLKEGAAKAKATNWDSGSPNDWPPDLYWTVTSDDGIFPAYESKIALNSFQLPREQALFYVLEGEKLVFNVFDDDGAEDEKLGQYPLTTATFDTKKEELGRMFGDVMGLSYSLSQRKLIRQPISTYLRPNIEYKDRKGVMLIFDYFLPQALVGQEMRPRVSFADKEHQKIDMPYYYAMEDAPRWGEKFKLEGQGKIAYFIPHYAWNRDLREIEFSLEGDGANTAEAAPYFIHQPIEFEGVISYSGYFVEDNFKYLGTSGIKLRLDYKARDIHRYSKLEINFLHPDGSPILFDIYPILPNAKSISPIVNSRYTLEKPEEEMSLEFFVPYIDLKAEAIRVELNLVPDMTIPVIAENSPRLRIPENTQDALFVKEKEETVFKEGDYGFVLTLQFNIPPFYRDRCRLDVEAERNAVPFLGYNAIGEGVEQLSIDTFNFIADSGRIYLILPYRRLTANDNVKITCRLVEKSTGAALSEVQSASWKLPQDIHNIETVFNLDAFEFDASVVASAGGDTESKWKYVLMVGNEAKISKTLPYKVKSKDDRAKFGRSVLVNREDLIQIKVVNKDDPSQEVFLWSGDLGKFQQNKFKFTIGEQKPVKKAKVSAKVPKNKI